jgi:multicomponent Na+:H+ antiporter subunit D
LRGGGAAGGCRVFLGWGPAEPEKVSAIDEETDIEAPAAGSGTPPLMLAVAIWLAALCLAAGAWFGLADAVTGAAERFSDGAAYARLVLEGQVLASPAPGSAAPRAYDWALGAGSALLAAMLALWVLRGPRHAAASSLWRAGEALLGRVEALHSGRIGDYVAWLVFGTAALGGAFALVIG